jgi:hypothetical protein
MIPKEILRKIRQIEIRSNRLVSESVAGAYHSVFQGQEMNFGEARDCGQTKSLSAKAGCFRNPEGFQTVAGGRNAMQTSGIRRASAPHPGGMPETTENGDVNDGQGAVLHPSGVPWRRVAAPEVCAALRPPATVCQPSGLLAEEIFRRKQASRREAAQLPIEEKLRILVEMQKRANEIRRAAGRPEMFVWELRQS